MTFTDYVFTVVGVGCVFATIEWFAAMWSTRRVTVRDFRGARPRSVRRYPL